MSLPTPKKGQIWTHRHTRDLCRVRTVQEVYVRGTDELIKVNIVVSETAESKYGGKDHVMVWQLPMFQEACALYVEVTEEVHEALERGGMSL